MLLTFLLLPFFLSFLFLPQNQSFPPHTRNEPGSPKVKALVVTAHPDDECMFFGPTILGLRQQNAEVYGLVLSNGEYSCTCFPKFLTGSNQVAHPGNSEGLGKERELELVESYAILGVDRDKVSVLDHP